jgi:hypothetical protein
MPVPPLPTRFAVLALLISASVWFGFLDAWKRSVLLMHFAGSAFAVVPLAPIPIALIAALLAWDWTTFRRWYFAWTIVFAVLFAVALLQGELIKGALDDRLLNLEAATAAGILWPMAWAAYELCRFCFAWWRGSHQTIARPDDV